MKPLFSRLLGHADPGTSNKEIYLPRPISINCLPDHQRRSMIGWIANRMGQSLRLEKCEEGELIYAALYKESISDDKEVIEGYLVFIASCLVEWMELGQDVYLKIKEMQLSDKHHRYLLQVYEEVKEYAESCFSQHQNTSNERSDDEILWEVYRDVIHAASQKKFLLIKESEISTYRQGEVICEEKIVERSDIPKARDAAKACLAGLGLPSSTVMEYVLLISEAITNILKHAKDGKLTIINTITSIHILIEDTGQGFPLKILPYTVLMSGYSTKKSLGQGFTLMLKLASQVLLKTSAEGSTLILLFNREEG